MVPRFASLPKLAAFLVAPLLLSHCATAPSVPKMALSGELTTPEHSLPRSEYPFDETGKYREDWVEHHPSRP